MLNMNQRQKFLFFWIIPFILINIIIFLLLTSIPSFTLTIGDTTDYKSVDIMIKKNSLFPIKSLSVNFENEPIVLATQSNGTYTATLDHNGTLEITMTNLNGMFKTEYDNINSIDDAPPTVNIQTGSKGSITISIEDTQSGIDYDSLYAIENDGTRITPSIINEGTSSATFISKSSVLEIHVSDMTGNESVSSYNIVEYENTSGLSVESEETTKAAETTKAKETTKASTTTKSTESTTAAATTSQNVSPKTSSEDIVAPTAPSSSQSSQTAPTAPGDTTGSATGEIVAPHP